MGDEKRMRNWLRGMPVVRGHSLKWRNFLWQTLYIQEVTFLHQMTEACGMESKERGERA